MNTVADPIAFSAVERLTALGSFKKAMKEVDKYLQVHPKDLAAYELKHLTLCLGREMQEAAELAEAQPKKVVRQAMTCNTLLARVIFRYVDDQFEAELSRRQRDCRSNPELSARLLSVEGRLLFWYGDYQKAAELHTKAHADLSRYSFWAANNALPWMKATVYAGWSKDERQEAWQAVMAHTRTGFLPAGQLVRAALVNYGGLFGRVIVGRPTR